MLVAPLTESRQHAKRRQTQELLNVIRGLQRFVKVFLEKGQTDAEGQTEDEPQRQVQEHARLNRAVRNDGGVDDVNVALLQARRDVGFLHAVQKPVVKLVVAVGLALDDVVL